MACSRIKLEFLSPMQSATFHKLMKFLLSKMASLLNKDLIKNFRMLKYIDFSSIPNNYAGDYLFNIARCIANSICQVARKLELHCT